MVCRDAQLIHESQIHPGRRNDFREFRFQAQRRTTWPGSDDAGRRRSGPGPSPASCPCRFGSPWRPRCGSSCLGGFQRKESVPGCDRRPARRGDPGRYTGRGVARPAAHAAQGRAAHRRRPAPRRRVDPVWKRPRGVSITLEGPAEFEIEPNSWTPLASRES